jgi:hypothetical protein
MVAVESATVMYVINIRDKVGGKQDDWQDFNGIKREDVAHAVTVDHFTYIIGFKKKKFFFLFKKTTHRALRKLYHYNSLGHGELFKCFFIYFFKYIDNTAVRLALENF